MTQLLLKLYEEPDGYRAALGDLMRLQKLRLQIAHMSLKRPADRDADAMFQRQIRHLNLLREAIWEERRNMTETFVNGSTSSCWTLTTYPLPRRHAQQQHWRDHCHRRGPRMDPSAAPQPAISYKICSDCYYGVYAVGVMPRRDSSRIRNGRIMQLAYDQLALSIRAGSIGQFRKVKGHRTDNSRDSTRNRDVRTN